MFILLKMFKKKKFPLSSLQVNFCAPENFLFRKSERKTSSIKIICTCREKKMTFSKYTGAAAKSMYYILWFLFLERIFFVIFTSNKGKN